MRVTLTWYEAAMASEIGRLRQLSSIKRQSPDAHGFEGVGWNEHIEGACGELAVAKLLGVYWDGSVDTFARNDLPGLQVRTRSSHGWDLIVRQDDADATRWVLVTGRCPTFLVRGWIFGHEAKRPQWLRTHGDRPGAYFVPKEHLRPMEALMEGERVQVA